VSSRSCSPRIPLPRAAADADAGLYGLGLARRLGPRPAARGLCHRDEHLPGLPVRGELRLSLPVRDRARRRGRDSRRLRPGAEPVRAGPALGRRAPGARGRRGRAASRPDRPGHRACRLRQAGGGRSGVARARTRPRRARTVVGRAGDPAADRALPRPRRDHARKPATPRPGRPTGRFGWVAPPPPAAVPVAAGLDPRRAARKGAARPRLPGAEGARRGGRIRGGRAALGRRGGLLGSLSLPLAGIEPFWPFLALAPWVHVGKGATMGLGAMRVTAA